MRSAARNRLFSWKQRDSPGSPPTTYSLTVHGVADKAKSEGIHVVNGAVLALPYEVGLPTLTYRFLHIGLACVSGA